MRASSFLPEIRRAAPYALALAALLGAVVIVGAHQSNAFPSADRPFGWPGPSSLSGAVAMARADLVLAASVPALLLGAMALRGRRAGLPLALTWVTHAALVGAGVLVGALAGAAGVREAPGDALAAFVVAHGVLALSFYSIGFLWSSLLGRHALAPAAATWLFFVGIYDRVLQTMLFRKVGYHELAAGSFPDWFWVSQAFSPLSSYRGILILWRPDFRDYVEKVALEGARLPGWIVPATFVALALALWMLIPLALAHLVGWWRAQRMQPAASRAPERV